MFGLYVDKRFIEQLATNEKVIIKVVFAIKENRDSVF